MKQICGNCKSESLIGKKFGKLLVVSLDEERTSDRRYKWVCLCECGNTKSVSGRSLKYGKTRSCGCINKRNYNTNTRLYKIWVSMRSRCKSTSNDAYHNYGGRGISVCTEWDNSFEKFEEWAKTNGYDDKLTIERKDVNGGYCPENCCWIPKDMQAKNRRNSHYITYNGRTQIISDWEKELGLSQGTIYHRLKAGWCEKDAVTKNPRKICKNCKWHEHESIDDGWVCVNADSEYCTDWTDYDHTCEDWEGRE